MGADEPRDEALRVEVAYSAQADRVELVALCLPAGATVAQALQGSGLAARYAAIDLACVGVWGRVVSLEQALCDGDRVEIYRPLSVDPKEARRLRYREQKARRAAPARQPPDANASGNRSR